MTPTAEDIRVETDATPLASSDEPVERKKRGRKPVKPTEAQPTIHVEWAILATYLHPLMVGVFARYKVAPPAIEGTQAVCIAWGRVAEKYLPNLVGYEIEVTAGLVTLGYIAPLIDALMRPRPVPVPVPTDGKVT